MLGSNAMTDRCGICGGDGDDCIKVKGIYNKTHTIIGKVVYGHYFLKFN